VLKTRICELDRFDHFDDEPELTQNYYLNLLLINNHMYRHTMCQSSVLTQSADNIHTAHLAALLDSGGSGLHYSDLLKTMYW
jgi:hypothetical protein